MLRSRDGQLSPLLILAVFCFGSALSCKVARSDGDSGLDAGSDFIPLASEPEYTESAVCLFEGRLFYILDDPSLKLDLPKDTDAFGPPDQLAKYRPYKILDMTGMELGDNLARNPETYYGFGFVSPPTESLIFSEVKLWFREQNTFSASMEAKKFYTIDEMLIKNMNYHVLKDYLPKKGRCYSGTTAKVSYSKNKPVVHASLNHAQSEKLIRVLQEVKNSKISTFGRINLSGFELMCKRSQTAKPDQAVQRCDFVLEPTSHVFASTPQLQNSRKGEVFEFTKEASKVIWDAFVRNDYEEQKDREQKLIPKPLGAKRERITIIDSYSNINQMNWYCDIVLGDADWFSSGLEHSCKLYVKNWTEEPRN